MPVAYLAAHEATNTLARSLAVELAPANISVNAIAPYHMYSQAFFPSTIGKSDPRFVAMLAERIPLNRFGDQAEIGPLIALLASGVGPGYVLLWRWRLKVDLYWWRGKPVSATPSRALCPSSRYSMVPNTAPTS